LILFPSPNNTDHLGLDFSTDFREIVPPWEYERFPGGNFHLLRMIMKDETQYPDEKCQIRCPRLGHHVSFSYCRWENGGLPCFKAVDCWFEQFPVEKCLKEELSSEEWKKVFENLPRPKMASLLDLIEQAKKLNTEGK
jgi:hypothetical protein